MKAFQGFIIYLFKGLNNCYNKRPGNLIRLFILFEAQKDHFLQKSVSENMDC